VQVSDCKETSNSVLCESAEATHGDRSTTVRVFSSLQLKNDFIRLDGQCKYCVVGSGAAEGNMRLPPLGYVYVVVYIPIYIVYALVNMCRHIFIYICIYIITYMHYHV
jgi:hypothetical protein